MKKISLILLIVIIFSDVFSRETNAKECGQRNNKELSDFHKMLFSSEMDSLESMYGNMSVLCRKKLVDYMLDSILLKEKTPLSIYERYEVFLGDNVNYNDYTYEQKEKLMRVLNQKYSFGIGHLFLQFRDTIFNNQFKKILETQKLEAFEIFQIKRILFRGNDKDIISDWSKSLDKMVEDKESTSIEKSIMLSDIVEGNENLSTQLYSIVCKYPNKYIFVGNSYKDEYVYESLLLCVIRNLQKKGCLKVDLLEGLIKEKQEDNVYYNFSEIKRKELLRVLKQGECLKKR